MSRLTEEVPIYGLYQGSDRYYDPLDSPEGWNGEKLFKSCLLAPPMEQWDRLSQSFTWTRLWKLPIGKTNIPIRPVNTRS